MRTLVVITVGLALAAGMTLAAQAAKPDFSGTWTLDKDRSYSNAPGFDQTMTLVHVGNEVKIEARLKTAQGEQNITETWQLDGEQRPYQPTSAVPAKGLRTASWMPGNRGILVSDEITTETPNGTTTMKVVRKLMLSSDRKTLAVDYYTDTQRGSGESKRVFVRQS